MRRSSSCRPSKALHGARAAWCRRYCAYPRRGYVDRRDHPADRKAKGVKTVICCDINDSSLERAKNVYGADHVINTKTKIFGSLRVQDIIGRTWWGPAALDSACFLAC